MAQGNSTQREKKKEMMRKNMLEGNGKRVSVSMPAAVLEHRKYILAAALLAAALFAFVMLCFRLYNYFRTYTTYQVNWSVKANNPSSGESVSFCGGLLAVGKDGAVYYNSKGSEQWSVPYEMSSPVPVSEGEYVLIYDRNGQSMVVCDRTGQTGSMAASYPISKADISAGGVTVAVLEDTRSSYIYYYRNNGEKLEVNIRSPIATSGYPLDISISPNGQQLAVSYYYLQGGSWACRVDFYDFEKGKDQPDRIVGTFSYQESDTYIPVVVYGSNSTAFSVGDNQINFYETSERTQIEQHSVALEGEIKKVFYDDQHLGLVIEEDDGLKIRIFDMNGSEKGTIEQEAVYETYSFDGKQIVMYSDSHCRIMTFGGRERFDLDFVNGIRMLIPAGNQKSFYLSTMDVIQKISLM